MQVKFGYEPKGSVWCYECKQEVKEGTYRIALNGIIDCPLCKRGRCTRFKDKIFRIKIPKIEIKWLDPKYLKTPKRTENHKAKIAAGVVAFNDIHTVRRMLASLIDFDYIIVCEGKYDVNPFGESHSTDGTLEILKRHPKVVIIDVAGMRQSDARNLYIQKAIELGCDHLLVIECDEYVTGDMQEFRDNLPAHGESGPYKTVYTTYMHYVPNHVVESPRFFYGLQHFRYGQTHSTYIIDGEEWFARNGETQRASLVKGIMVNHDELPRTKEEQDKALIFQMHLAVQEKQERERLKGACKYL